MIYFIQNNQKAIKIGYTRDKLTLKWRLVNLKLSNSDSLKIINIIEGGTHLEKALHKKFAFCRIHGEWFNPTPKLLLFIKNPQCNQLKKDYSTEKDNHSKNNHECKQCGYKWYKSARFQTTCPWCSSKWPEPEKEESFDIRGIKFQKIEVKNQVPKIESKQPKSKSQKINKFEYIINNHKFKAITKTNKPKIE